MVRVVTLWDDTLLLRQLVTASLVTAICAAAGWVLGSAVLGAGVGLALWGYGVAQDWVERRTSVDDESPSASESTDVDYLRILRARVDGDVETLIAALEDEIDASLAASFLGKLGAVSAIPALVSLLEATDPQQRTSAVVALGTLNALTACPRIMKLAEQDEVPEVRSCATQAVGRLTCGSEQFFVRALDDDDRWVRAAAAEALVHAGGPDAIPALQAAGQRVNWFFRGIYRKAIRRIRGRARQR
jgi:HEAT repeat protein